ncbi:hypothetical protein Lalb_Chr14g0370961 [Lupinus albus]|uniref:Uncharacterized protein n=1 Tax=Lupinus albus TaxID=3870 RepID=A0A6A4PFH8_LUPAL|nr:hypothetical protein Lalb_Chr14g0370961 [Lupinus albus]
MLRKLALEDKGKVRISNRRRKWNENIVSTQQGPKSKEKLIEFLCSSCMLCICCPIAAICCCIKLPCRIFVDFGVPLFLS